VTVDTARIKNSIFKLAKGSSLNRIFSGIINGISSTSGVVVTFEGIVLYVRIGELSKVNAFGAPPNSKLSSFASFITPPVHILENQFTALVYKLSK
jgi:hypothetical protein